MANFVILGAGAPHRVEIPAALREPRAGTSMLQWLLEATGSSVRDAIFGLFRGLCGWLGVRSFA